MLRFDLNVKIQEKFREIQIIRKKIIIFILLCAPLFIVEVVIARMSFKQTSFKCSKILSKKKKKIIFSE
jgi:hypothetical protein